MLLAIDSRPFARSTQEDTPRPPDVVIVLADDLSWPEIAAADTPALDALARDGVAMTSCFAMPVCSPGRYSLLFGRWPRRSGMGGNVNSFEPPAPHNPAPEVGLSTLPRLFGRGGYTSALVGKWHLGQAPDVAGDPMLAAPRAHGFDHWLAGAPANLRAREGTGYRHWIRVDDDQQRIESTYATVAQRDAALEWWRATEGPRFLLVSLSAPHLPFAAPPPELRYGEVDRRHGQRGMFLAMVASIDIVVGALRAECDPASTLFVFLADNGTAPLVFGAGQDEAKGTTNDTGIRVPCLVAGPGVVPGATCDQPVSLIDVMSTLAEVCGLAPAPGEPGGEDSRSFAGALRDPAGWRPERSWILAERYDDEVDDLCVRDAAFKLRRLNGAEWLVDVVADPDEARPLPTDGELDARQRAARDRLRSVIADELPPRARARPAGDR
jgi:arylsulfatase A-like enzyme